MEQIKRRKPYRPKLFNLMGWCIFYLTFTVFLFYAGPVRYNIKNPWLVFILLMSYHIALWAGYKVAERSALNKARFTPIEYKSCNNVSKEDKKLVKNLIVISIIVTVLLIVRISNSINPVVILNEVVDGIKTPSKQYAEQYLNSQQGNRLGGGLLGAIITIGQPVYIAAMILGVYYFTSLDFKSKISLIVLFALQLCAKFIAATNEGIFDMAIYVGVAVFLRLHNGWVNPNAKGKKTSKLPVFLALGGLAVLALVFFTKNILGRTQGNFALGTLGENYYDEDAFINRFIPDWLKVTFVYLSVYLCEGYYGFAWATTLKWVPNWGTGFSSFIRNNLSDLLGVDLFQYSYQVRVEQVTEWGALRNFHTAYTFWANDVSFLGVILVMFVLGYVLNKCYRGSVIHGSKCSVVMMPLLLTMIFYLPANNKVFVQPASFLLIAFICGYKLIKHFKKRRIL